MKYLYLDVSGMICAGCSNAVKTRLVSMEGINDASVDHIAGNAIVTYDPRLRNQFEVIELIGKLGYFAKTSQPVPPGITTPTSRQENSL